MKSNILVFFKSFLFILLFSNVSAEEPRFYIPDSPPIAAKAFVLMDHNSGKILAGENENERRAESATMLIELIGIRIAATMGDNLALVA